MTPNTQGLLASLATADEYTVDRASGPPPLRRRCTVCGSEIARARLLAIPSATRCIACQRVAEEAGKADRALLLNDDNDGSPLDSLGLDAAFRPQDISVVTDLQRALRVPSVAALNYLTTPAPAPPPSRFGKR